ncbi:GNAT family N-acetyltransferase [Palleronia abyssalis]|uniref:N-acetyltransferase domain-containing protein n=1 Tax=Palleronia abyssalis TaxID=1501240 RepID=A0A2R8BWD0_9RHOB|nr:GNAT family N-acetyltransferase [Palleronia abyssalis]SPJ24462.1 hypothetical protein PAA8504_02293 [Palleronia abyssalis]
MSLPFPRIGRPGAAPTLSTPRLVLRPPQTADWDAYRQIMTGPRATHMGGPFGANVAWGMFMADMWGWAVTGAGALTITRAEDGIAVGQVVLNDIPAFPDLELGWMLYDGHEGHGYATEAAAAFLDWIRRELRPASLVSYVSPDNAGSAGVARRLGGEEDVTADRPDPADLVFRHVGDPR